MATGGFGFSGGSGMKRIGTCEMLALSISIGDLKYGFVLYTYDDFSHEIR